jgi:ferredoxin
VHSEEPMTTRKIIEIDEGRCDGCGHCIAACAEGALALVDGKARLVGDVFCDGLGACIGDCPRGALTVVEREADPFDEAAADRVGDAARDGSGRAGASPSPPLACGCPGTHEMTLVTGGTPLTADPRADDRPSELSHWPIKLRLLNPSAPYLAGADLVLLADCAAAACPNLHARLLRGRCVALGCPKFDDVDLSVGRLADIIREASPSSIAVAHMEVPCCHGLLAIAERAVARSSPGVPVSRIIVSRTGELTSDRDRAAEGRPVTETSDRPGPAAARGTRAFSER